MHRLFETLEGRRMLSATMLGMPVRVAAHPPAVHAPLSQNMPMRFQGTATSTTAGVPAVQLQMLVVKTDKGFRAELTAVSDLGKRMNFALKLGADGSFTVDRKEKTGSLHLEGKVSADLQTVAGTFTDTRTDGSSSGAFL